MAYSKTNWQNLPNQTTPINSSNLNKMENGIADSYNSIGVDAYDNTSTYAVGDYCIYNNTLYRCTTAIQSAEEWTLAHWEATSIKDTIKDSGWKTATYTNKFRSYDNQSYNALVYRKIGKMIEMHGMISNTVELASGGNGEVITNLPEGFRPSTLGRYIVCQGSGTNKWLLTVNTNGNVTIARYGGSSQITIPANSWLPLTITFLID